VALLLERDSQAEICIGVARVSRDCSLQGRNGIRHAADLEAGQAEIVMDDGIRGLQRRRIAQRRDRVGWPPSPQKLSG
jgi:hypothetical protein